MALTLYPALHNNFRLFLIAILFLFSKDIKRFIYQNVRPRKSAFIIRNGDWTALEKAVKISTLAWGGIFNLILITENETKISEYNQILIDIFDPDCFYVLSIEDVELIDILDNKGYEVSKIKDTFEHPSISPIGILINSVAFTIITAAGVANYWLF